MSHIMYQSPEDAARINATRLRRENPTFEHFWAPLCGICGHRRGLHSVVTETCPDLPIRPGGNWLGTRYQRIEETQ